MNVIARLTYELAYYDSAVHRFNHYTTRTTPRLREKSISWQYYVLEIRQTKKAVKSKCRRLLRTYILLLQNNMPVQIAEVTVVEAANSSFVLLSHPPYLRDLIIFLILLSPKLKFQPQWKNRNTYAIVKFLEEQNVTSTGDRIWCLRNFELRVFMSREKFIKNILKNCL